jgi:WD40 repeat protein
LWETRGGIVDKTQPDLVVREIPRSAALAYSPDSRCLAVGTADSIRLWDARVGVEMARLANRSGDVSRVAFSPDGAHLASASRDWPILVWTLAGQRVELALNGHTAGVNSLAYSTDGKTLISGSDDSTVRLWDAENGQAIARVTGHTGPVLSAALSPDGKFAASGGSDRAIRLWNVERKQTAATLTGHGRPVVALAFSPDGRFLVSAEGRSGVPSDSANRPAQRPLRLWRIPQGAEQLAFGPAGAEISDVAFSPDSKTLAASGPQGVTLWDPRTGEIRESLRPVSSGTAAASRSSWPIAFAPDGQSLAAGGDAALSIWSAAPFGAALSALPSGEGPKPGAVPSLR